MSNRGNSDVPPASELRAAQERIADLEAENRRLRREAEQFRSVAMSATQSLIVAQAGKLVFFNPPFAEMVSYSPDEFTSMGFIEFVHPDDRAGLVESYARALATGPAPDDFEFRTVARNGAHRWYRIRARVGEWDGQPALFCAIAERTAEKSSEKKYQDLLEMVPTGVFEVDLERGHLLMVNDLMCEVLGYARGELMAMDPVDLLFPDDRAHGLEHRKRAREGLPIERTVERRVRCKDGREVWVLFTDKVSRHGDGSVTSFTVAQDITEQKRREEEQRRVERLESLGVLAGGIAHDFNNLLTSILGNATLGRRCASDGGRVARVFDEIDRACQRASNLTQQLLTFSQGGAPVRRVAAIAPTVRECAALAVRGSAVGCSFDIPEELHNVDADEGQIGQVITNLVINAKQSMPDGGHVAVAAANIEVDEGSRLPLAPGAYLRVSVSDQGAGIAAEHLPRIFDPYFSTKAGGSGLGLATAHSILKRHAGHLAVESRLGDGTTFHLFLPATDRKPVAETEPSATAGVASGSVLFMDDEAPVRGLGVAMLEELGFNVVAAASGEEAVEAYVAHRRQGSPFDAAVLDLTVVGGMGGKEAIARLRAIDPAVKAVVMSGYSNDPVLADPVSYGFATALAKPFTIDQMGVALARLLAVEED